MYTFISKSGNPKTSIQCLTNLPTTKSSLQFGKKNKSCTPPKKKTHTTFLEDVFFLFQDFLQQKHLHLPRKNHRHRTSFQQPPGGPPGGAPPGGPPGGGGYHGAPPPHGGWKMMGF